ncbi:MAG: hypothetical protein GY856_19050 [bacterium]|nr:hypothetical protein [bacterium]
MPPGPSRRWAAVHRRACPNGRARLMGRKVLGVEKILAQNPCKPLGSGTGKKDPAPMLFFSMIPGVARAMANEYLDFEDHHRSGSARMIEAAKRGYLLDLAYSPSTS